MQQKVTMPKQVNQDLYRTQNASIQDISKKYGFDYSREYAARQANAEAQAKRDQANQGLRQVDSNVRSSARGLDQNYFQQYMNQAQGQVNGGVNAGIASDQNLRLSMGRQNSLGDIYSNANNQRFELNNMLGRVEQERLAREDGLYNDRLQQGFQNSMAYTDRQRQENQAMLQAAMQQYGLDLSQYQWGTDFNRQLGRDKVQDNQWQQSFDWDKHQFNNLSAYQSRSLAEQAKSRQASASSAAQNKAMMEAAQRQYEQQQRFIQQNSLALQQGSGAYNDPMKPILQLQQQRQALNPPKSAPSFTGGPLDQMSYLRR